MLSIAKPVIAGYVKILDAETKEVILDTKNAVHFGNLSKAIADALVGDNTSFITYMTFGNGGTVISGSTINYKPPNVSTAKDPNAQLYNTTFIRKLTNESTPPAEVDANNFVNVPGEQAATNFEDIIATVLLEFGDSGPTGQDPIDTGQPNDQFVFDEIALYAGPFDALSGSETSDVGAIQQFVVNINTSMLTHVIFNPIQKSQNRSLEVVYTLRIQMGE